MSIRPLAKRGGSLLLLLRCAAAAAAAAVSTGEQLMRTHKRAPGESEEPMARALPLQQYVYQVGGEGEGRGEDKGGSGGPLSGCVPNA